MFYTVTALDGRNPSFSPFSLSHPPRPPRPHRPPRLLQFLLSIAGRLDNVDNRITNDMELLSFTFSNFFFGDGLITPWSGGLLNIIAIAVVFTVQGYVAGYWLDISLVYIYTFVTAVGVLPLLKWVAGAAYERQVAEGEFRYLHGYVRSYAESITVLCGQRAEYALATRSLQRCGSTTLSFSKFSWHN